MTIFEKIVKGEIPSFKIWEDRDHYAFLDIRPLAPGHTLVIPKKAIDSIFRLNDEDYQALFLAAKRVSEILKAKIECERVCLAVVGFEVPHAHIHLVPARSMADFPWPGSGISNLDESNLDELKIIHKKIIGDF